MFRLSVKNPLVRVTNYANTLKKVDVSKIDSNITKYGNVMFDNNCTRSDKELINSNEFRTLLSALMVHPDDYTRNGKFKNWYNFGNYTRTHQFYNGSGWNDIDRLEECWDKHREIVLAVKKTDDLKFGKQDIEEYKKFMKILSIWDGVPKEEIAPFVGNDIDTVSAVAYVTSYAYYMFANTNFKTNSFEETRDIFGNFHVIPDLKTALLWQSHMLDHRRYVRDSLNFGGKIIENSLYNKTNYEIEMGKLDTKFLMDTEIDQDLD